MSTMTNEHAPSVARSGDTELHSPLEARLMRAEANGLAAQRPYPAVKVTAFCAGYDGERSMLDGKVYLVAIDRADEFRTFRVTADEDGTGTTQWVYDVRPFDAVPSFEEATEGLVLPEGDVEAMKKPALRAKIAELTEALQMARLEIDTKATTVESLTTRLGEAQNRHSSVYREFESFKEQVRDVAIRVAEEQSWCDPGLNEVLEELGLEPKKTEQEVEFDVLIRVHVTATTTNLDNATDEEFITSSIRSVQGSVDLDSDWEDVSVDSYEIEGVENAEEA